VHIIKSLAFWPMCLAVGACSGVGAEEPVVRVFEFGYQVRVKDLPPAASRVRVWLPFPASDAHQEISRVSISAPSGGEIHTEPAYGNTILYLEMPGSGTGAFDVGAKFTVRRRENAHGDFRVARIATADVRDQRLSRWLQPDRLIPLDSRIRGLASEVTASARTDVERIRAIYDYVLANMKYDKSGSGWGNGDIYWACDAKRGNCTDFHALFIGLARAVGIPAKFVIGFSVPEDRASGEVSGYHCWTEFYLPGYGWIPVDASEASKNPAKREYFFGNIDANRVQLSVGRDIELVPRHESAPLNYFVYPYVEVDGKPFTRVDKKFSFTSRDRRQLRAVSAAFTR
jgi:transglutaminase-like putative cysteine protease